MELSYYYLIEGGRAPKIIAGGVNLGVVDMGMYFSGLTQLIIIASGMCYTFLFGFVGNK